MIPLALVMTAGGLVLLVAGGEVLLRGAVGLAIRSNLSPLLVGLTVVATATSLPELMVTVTAGLGGVPDIGVGNIVGSNIANILLILGLTGMISPIPTQPRQVWRDGSFMLAATAMFIVLALLGEINFIHGCLMLASLVCYIWISYRGEAGNVQDIDLESLERSGRAPCSIKVAFCLLLVGVAGLVAGSELLVRGAVEIARAAGVSETVIGLTLVAFGTSLPELATAAVAGLRGHAEVALGNVLGSNILNILLILGVLALLTPIQVAAEVRRFDMWVLAAVTVAALPMLLIGGKFGRFKGASFLLLYCAFVLYQFYPGHAAN